MHACFHFRDLIKKISDRKMENIMKLILELNREDFKKLQKIANAKKTKKEEIAQTMIETMIVWLIEKHPNDLG